MPNRVRVPNISRMLHLIVRRPGVLLGREVRPHDVISIDLSSDQPVVLVSEVPRNVGQLLGALTDGAVDPIDITPDVARELLSPSPASPPRVLPLRPRLVREGFETAG